MDIFENTRRLIDPDFSKTPEVDPVRLEEFCISAGKTELAPDWAKKWNPDSHSNISIYDPTTRSLNSRFISEVVTAYANATADIPPELRAEMHPTLQVSLSHMLRSLKAQSILLDLKKGNEVNGPLLSEFWNSHFSRSIGKFIKSNDHFINAISHYKLGEQATIHLLEFAQHLNAISTRNPIKTTDSELATPNYTENRLDDLLKPIEDFAQNIALSGDRAKWHSARNSIYACTEYIANTYEETFELLNYLRRTVIYDPKTTESRRFTSMESQIGHRIHDMNRTTEALKQNLKNIGIDHAIIDFVSSRFDKVEELFYEITNGTKEFIKMLNNTGDD